MFANALPVRSILEPSNSFQTFLHLIQSQQQKARNYEYCKITQISTWANIPKNKTIFDSLFIFHTPWKDFTSGSVKVSDFKSGLTTTYPITATFQIEDCILYRLLVNTNIITSSVTDWFFKIVPTICNVVLNNANSSIHMILNELPEIPDEITPKDN
jgi:hypothetical protein